MTRNTDDQHRHRPALVYRWEAAAMVAVLIILGSPFVYLWRDNHQAAPIETGQPAFVGSERCGSCHKETFATWRGSHHDLAMDVATEQTVRGDFANASYTDPHNDVTSRFFREGDGFFVETIGEDGTPARFEITHTFGVYPLQQYLIAFPGGRLQSFTIGWDDREKRWYRLPPYEVSGPDDWLHWTSSGQTFNAMCAECHSTRVNKGYDMATDTYDTRWFEIDVGCESCHGPGSAHVAWADRPPLARAPVPDYRLVMDTGTMDAAQQITICAPCHARRYQLGDNNHDNHEVLDIMVPSLLDEGLYYPDGQILEEVYVYGSFTQSKMYMHNVRCSDCHDMHSLKLHAEGNDLCLQCHRGAIYDQPSHHFHKREHEGKPSEGYLCVKCHMPGRTYMGIDYRLDHSLRVPRPDLSLSLGTPNSCSSMGCHDDKELSWVNDAYTRWYGQTRPVHYGEVIAGGRQRAPEVHTSLLALAEDQLVPAIVRATALSLLRQYPGAQTTELLSRLLADSDALIRHTAIRSLEHSDPDTRLRLIAPKLYDPVKAVRIEAAVALAGLGEDELREDDRQRFAEVLAEYEQAMRYNGDFAPQRYNLGNLAAAVGDDELAVAHYEAALAIDDQFFPARVNLAMLYNRRGDNDKAVAQLRRVVAAHPLQFEAAYSLGLLLAEMGDFEGAAVQLGRAADGMAGYSRVRYNYALALMKLQRWSEAEQALLMTIEVEPGNETYFSTLANLYLGFGMQQRARQLAASVLAAYPDHRAAAELLARFQ